jgi:LmbE family N-acetylglucosaminyl deacetylase
MVATLVCFHAHPDDESIATGGTMIQAADAGHRVVLVLATKGELGERPEGVVAPDADLAELRVRETQQSAEILGVARVEYLGYGDSGMEGWPSNDEPGSFWKADVEQAARRLAAILEEEAADVLTVYDDNGAYGHPDHIQVHRVGVRAAELAGTPHVYESSINRDEMKQMMEDARAAGIELGDDEPGELPESFGRAASLLTTVVDVGAVLDRKRASMRAHASQIGEQSFFLAMPDDAFARAFGREWYIRRGVALPVEEYETALAGLT